MMVCMKIFCRVLLCLCLLMDIKKERKKDREDFALFILMSCIALELETGQRSKGH